MAFAIETMITGIDHIIIRCSNPIELMDAVRTQLDVPILIPPHDYGDFCSGIIRLGNLDLEFLRFGKETIPKPYFYGIAFASAENPWRTTAWLKALQIPHTPPIHTTIMRDGRQWGWSTILLDGFLDDPISVPYSLGAFSGDGLIARGIAGFLAILMIPSLRRFTSSQGGGSMCFVCHYSQDMSSLRTTAAEKLAASGGGKNQIIEVDSVAIESNSKATPWEKLLATGEIYKPRLAIQTGVANRIQQIVIRSKSLVPIASMCFGDAVFSFQN
jgi:hypothetical protein